VRIVNRRERWAKWTGVMLGLSATYAAAYSYTLVPRHISFVGRSWRSANYLDPFGNQRASRAFFWPANRIDRLVRSDYWSVTLQPAAVRIDLERGRY